MYYECRHVMHNGARCHSPALNGKPYCYFHVRLHNLAQRSRQNATPAESEPLTLPIIEDRSAVLVAITQVLNAFGSKAIDRPTASLFLYGLQLASQNVERRHDLLPIRAIETLSLTRDGEELAPESRICIPPGDCVTCEIRETCPHRKNEEEEEDET